MRDTNRQNDELNVLDFVHLAVVPNPEPLQASYVALQRATEMRGIGQPVDDRIDPRLTTSPQAKHNN